jgi:hypothetical protein
MTDGSGTSWSFRPPVDEGFPNATWDDGRVGDARAMHVRARCRHGSGAHIPNVQKAMWPGQIVTVQPTSPGLTPPISTSSRWSVAAG